MNIQQDIDRLNDVADAVLQALWHSKNRALAMIDNFEALGLLSEGEASGMRIGVELSGYEDLAEVPPGLPYR